MSSRTSLESAATLDSFKINPRARNLLLNGYESFDWHRGKLLLRSVDDPEKVIKLVFWQAHGVRQYFKCQNCKSRVRYLFGPMAALKCTKCSGFYKSLQHAHRQDIQKKFFAGLDERQQKMVNVLLVDWGSNTEIINALRLKNHETAVDCNQGLMHTALQVEGPDFAKAVKEFNNGQIVMFTAITEVLKDGLSSSPNRAADAYSATRSAYVVRSLLKDNIEIEAASKVESHVHRPEQTITDQIKQIEASPPQFQHSPGKAAIPNTL